VLKLAVNSLDWLQKRLFPGEFDYLHPLHLKIRLMINHEIRCSIAISESYDSSFDISLVRMPTMLETARKTLTGQLLPL
jgi:hypothetical protein